MSFIQSCHGCCLLSALCAGTCWWSTRCGAWRRTAACPRCSAACTPSAPPFPCSATSCGPWPAELQTKVREDFTIRENVPTRAFSWLKEPTSSFTFKTLSRHYTTWPKHGISRRDIRMPLQRSFLKGSFRVYANQTACSWWPLHRHPNFMSTYRGLTSI